QSDDSICTEGPVPCALYGQLPLGRRLALRQGQEKPRCNRPFALAALLHSTSDSRRWVISSSKTSLRPNCTGQAERHRRRTGSRARHAVLSRRLRQG
ncbi:hypothetical protein BV20DRAFT_908049, partial [Pilatotrama ljubarskyi]